MHLRLQPQPNLWHPEDSFLKHDQVHFCMKHELKLCLGPTQNQ